MAADEAQAAGHQIVAHRAGLLELDDSLIGPIETGIGRLAHSRIDEPGEAWIAERLFEPLSAPLAAPFALVVVTIADIGDAVLPCDRGLAQGAAAAVYDARVLAEGWPQSS